MASEANIFGTNQRFKESVQLINSLPDGPFPRILLRLTQKLHLKNERPFSEEEEEKLGSILSLKPTEVQSVLDSTSFILEQAAYYAARPEILGLQLEHAGVSASKISAFQSVWTEGGSELIGKLRKQTIVPKQLDQIGWRFHLQLSQNTLSKLKEPAAIFKFDLNSSTGNEAENESFRLEFTPDELFNFFTKLELIQEQLDNLL
eukprot:TRINITY_DN253_c0_g1_i2.p1 TRINITY_DN253_c0_g1~~TRINITY_DN253_c0_g1_i2.p1  ORF type:complete len:204 (+),score=79.76 TRINITY_DN253_c0_g1_i2:601-1212(+)